VSPDLPPWAVELLHQSRVARLGTADRTGRPLVVPVCYAFDGRACVTAIDAKPKRVPGRRLRRVRNIEENPRAALVVDRYDEDWSGLRWVLVEGGAAVLTGGAERARAYAKRLTSADGSPATLALCDKRREKANVAEVMNVVGDVKGRSCLIVDDMCDTGGSLTKVAAALRDAGAERIHASFTHAVLSGHACSLLADSEIERVVTTDTIPLRVEKLFQDPHHMPQSFALASVLTLLALEGDRPAVPHLLAPDHPPGEGATRAMAVPA